MAESRRVQGNDAAACFTGVLICQVDSAALTGEGPVRILNANPTTTPPTGCTPLDLAAYAPGQSFTDPVTGVCCRHAEGPALCCAGPPFCS
ncbi:MULTISPECIES: hypothetical protein [unclassified Streptomyces]|uniref:hypothetical protein n=1 Tax=unclassified Streptomyces TaxID=2593676 RepID=UPI001F0417F8|nr:MULTISPECIES: hypothetical protein [unclassified Streptomyces]